MDFLTSMRNRGWKGISLANYMGWFGEGNPVKIKRNMAYTSTDIAVISKQCELMQSVGVQGVIAWWQGTVVNPFLHLSVMRMSQECQKRGMWFCVGLDGWIAKGQPNPTHAVITQLQTADFQSMIASSAYLPEQYILEFDLASIANVDMTAVRAALPKYNFLSKHIGYSWPEGTIQNTLATLARDNQNPSMKIPGLTARFNDGGQTIPPNANVTNWTGNRDYSLSVWGGGPCRVLDSQAGVFWASQVKLTPTSPKYIMAVTWNDYDENTQIEDIIAILNGVQF